MPGIRQPTSFPSRRVSARRIFVASAQTTSGSAAAARRWYVRTLALGSHWSSASLTPVSCPSHASDPAQARGLLVLSIPLAGLRPLGEPAVLDARDARPGAVSSAAG